MESEGKVMKLKRMVVNSLGCLAARWVLQNCNDGLIVSRKGGARQVIKAFSEPAYRNMIKPAIHKECDPVYAAYRSEPEFRRYVNQYCANRGITVEESLQHALVRETRQYYREENGLTSKQVS